MPKKDRELYIEGDPPEDAPLHAEILDAPDWPRADELLALESAAWAVEQGLLTEDEALVLYALEEDD